MANIRIKDLSTDSALSAGDYVVVDSASEGSRKFDLGTELADLKSGIENISGVPNTVRQAIYTLLSKAVYTETGLTDEKAIVEEWASTQVTGITLSENSITFSSSGTHQLNATLTPSGVMDTPFWQSSNTNVATVSNNGLVTAVGNGSCTIYATIGQLVASCSVSVSGISELVTITNTLTKCTSSNAAISIYEGDDYSATLTAATGYTLTGATVTVTMGGVDITSTAYDNGTITINDVDGAIEITAESVLKGTNFMTDVNSTNWTISQYLPTSDVDGHDFTCRVPDTTHGYSYNSNMIQKNLSATSDSLANKTVFIEFDLELSGKVGNDDQLIFCFSAFDRSNPTSGSQRKGNATVNAAESGHYSYEIAASETDIQQSSSYYLGIMIFLYGGKNCTARVTNAVATYY